ncbi:MAG: hypothetical protein ACLSFT_03000 [Ruminococcus callidus]
MDGRKAQAPGKFGIASEDINCRCHAHSRPRWAVRADGDYKYDNQHRALVKISSESYAAYRAGYVLETAGETGRNSSGSCGACCGSRTTYAKDNGGTGKTYRAEKIGGKALTSGGDGGIIKASGIRVNLQLFANKNIAKMSSVQLEKSIKAWKSKVEEHREKFLLQKNFILIGIRLMKDTNWVTSNTGKRNRQFQDGHIKSRRRIEKERRFKWIKSNLMQ